MYPRRKTREQRAHLKKKNRELLKPKEGLDIQVQEANIASNYLNAKRHSLRHIVFKI